MANLSIKDGFPRELLTALKVNAALSQTTLRTYVIRALESHVMAAKGNAVLSVSAVPSETVQKAYAVLHRAANAVASALLVDRLRESREQVKARMGRCEGQKPFGHYESEGPVLAEIRSMRDAGMRNTQIAAALDSGGVSTRSGGKWNAAVIGRILRRG